MEEWNRLVWGWNWSNYLCSQQTESLYWYDLVNLVCLSRLGFTNEVLTMGWTTSAVGMLVADKSPEGNACPATAAAAEGCSRRFSVLFVAIENDTSLSFEAVLRMSSRKIWGSQWLRRWVWVAFRWTVAVWYLSYLYCVSDESMADDLFHIYIMTMCLFFVQVQFTVSIHRKRNQEDQSSIRLFLTKRRTLPPER